MQDSLNEWGLEMLFGKLSKSLLALRTQYDAINDGYIFDFSTFNFQVIKLLHVQVISSCNLICSSHFGWKFRDSSGILNCLFLKRYGMDTDEVDEYEYDRNGGEEYEAR